MKGDQCQLAKRGSIAEDKIWHNIVFQETKDHMKHKHLFQN